MRSISELERTLALIPARGGSKGLPGKNIRPLAGRPLLAWSIAAAQQAGLDRIEVSTDTSEIAAVARQHGARVPGLRPAALATDTASSIDLALHCLDQASKRGERYKYLLLLQPTSPLRTASDIRAAFKLLRARKGAAVVSVCPCEHHPWHSNTLPEDAAMTDFLRPELQHQGRQQLPRHYRLNGAIYLARTDYLKEQHGFIGADTYALILPPERSIDIDNQLDFDFAEFLLNRAAC